MSKKKINFSLMLHFYTLGKIQGQLTSGFPVDAEIPWCPYSWMCSTKFQKSLKKNRQNTLKDFPGQKVVLSEQVLKHGILKFAENRKETFFCKSINTRHIFQNCMSACLRVSICFPVRLWCLWFLWSLTWD